MDLTLGAAIFAGVVSFLSPCVLPVVPAYLGQLGIASAAATSMAAASVATMPSGRAPIAFKVSRWRALPHALAFVVGFGALFTLLGLTFYVFRPLFDLPLVRQVGGIVVILLGLNLMGVLRFRWLNRSWSPQRFGEAPLGGAAARSPLGALALGSIFALAHTPCVGPTLGAILGLSVTSGAAPDVVLLLVGYSLGIGVPFIVLAIALDSADRFTRPFLRHGRTIELIGGGLVVLIGLAIFFDALAWFAQTFRSLWPQV